MSRGRHQISIEVILFFNVMSSPGSNIPRIVFGLRMRFEEFSLEFFFQFFNSRVFFRNGSKMPEPLHQNDAHGLIY
jgi:hypothetical protein